MKYESRRMQVVGSSYVQVATITTSSAVEGLELPESLAAQALSCAGDDTLDSD